MFKDKLVDRHVSLYTLSFSRKNLGNCSEKCIFFCFSRYAELLTNILCPFNTIQGGSVGKGTAVKGKADIDCVVFLNNVKTMEEHKLNLKKTKKALKSCLKQSPDEDQINLKFEGQTKFAVKFKLDSMSREFDVDLLPTFTTNQTLGKIGF